MDGAHDAMIDTQATVDILDAMVKVEPELKDLDEDGLHQFAIRNENMVDFAGKFTKNEAGVICFNFGKHRNEPVSKELGFLDWMMDKDFTQDTLNWAKKIKKGEVI